MDYIDMQLAERDLRRATAKESGWYVIVATDDGPAAVWATDADAGAR